MSQSWEKLHVISKVIGTNFDITFTLNSFLCFLLDLMMY